MVACRTKAEILSHNVGCLFQLCVPQYIKKHHMDILEIWIPMKVISQHMNFKWQQWEENKDCKLEVDVCSSLQKQMVAILLTWQLNNNVKFPVVMVTRANAYDGIATWWRINQSANAWTSPTIFSVHQSKCSSSLVEIAFYSPHCALLASCYSSWHISMCRDTFHLRSGLKMSGTKNTKILTNVESHFVILQQLARSGVFKGQLLTWSQRSDAVTSTYFSRMPYICFIVISEWTTHNNVLYVIFFSFICIFF